MRRNSVVEELLRRVPGLSVDMNGNMTYNGEKIQHLLVDGEDIFGSDPTMVTRNFDASKIAKVQILDRKTEQSLFTGIDDGTRIKTLNLVLKESAKEGYFGKAEAGANTAGYYNGSAALAAFKNKEQFTALGFASNTGGLGFNSGSGGGFSDINFVNGNADALGASAGAGIPRFGALALHYANLWDASAVHLVSNYQYSHYFTAPLTTTQTEQVGSGTVFGQDQRSESRNEQDQHWGYGSLDWAPNRTSSFKVNFHISDSRGQNQFSSAGSSTFGDTLVNSSDRNINDRVSRTYTGGEISWRTNIGKLSGRTFSINTSVAELDSRTDGYLYSVNKFYSSNGGLQSADTVDQRKEISDRALNVGARLNFTQPLWVGTVLGFSYGINSINDDPIQGTFDRGDGKYLDRVDSLSTDLQALTISQRATVSLQGKFRNLTYSAGVDRNKNSFRQSGLFIDSAIQLSYLSWTPRASLNYNINPMTSLLFSYNTSVQQPAISQLESINNNADPLHLSLGNPNLRPTVSQNFGLNFRRFRRLLVNVGVSATLIQNSISSRTLTDSLGRQINQPFNVDGSGNAGVNFSISGKVAGVDIGFHSSSTFSRNVNYVNADLSRNDMYNLGGGLSLSKYVTEKYSFQLNTNFFRFDSRSSINTAVPVRYWSQSHSGVVAIYILRHFELNTSATYSWQEKTSAFVANTSVLLWNSFISRNFLQDRLVVKAQLNNALNQNSGITRTSVNNINSESNTNILGRYWMFSVAYHFDRKLKKN